MGLFSFFSSTVHADAAEENQPAPESKESPATHTEHEPEPAAEPEEEPEPEDVSANG
jgi:hypothetical protein